MYLVKKKKGNSVNTNVHRKTKKRQQNCWFSAKGWRTVNQANVIWSRAKYTPPVCLGATTMIAIVSSSHSSRSKGLASYFELCFWSKKIKTLKSIFVLFKNYKDFFSIPACKLVHCACVSVDCPVISFYDNLHSFVVRALADTFFLKKKKTVLLEEKYNKWTNVVIITRVVY